MADEKFTVVDAVRGEEPLLIGLVGPPGGGKSMSSLRLAMGMQRVRKGPVVLIDTEGGRSKKFAPAEGRQPDMVQTFPFKRIEFGPPFRSDRFQGAIELALSLDPAAVIVDVLSDEHEGEGGYLDWHDAIVNAKRGEPGYVGGNEWAAWAKPKAARKRFISSLYQIKVPILFTFRAREKTQQQAKKSGQGTEIVNIGWMPVAPLEIVHALDLTCILPPRANGVPVWTSEKIGEDFIVKLPGYLAPLVQDGQLNEDIGEALARWALGGPVKPVNGPQQPQPDGLADALRAEILTFLRTNYPPPERESEGLDALEHASGSRSWKTVKNLDAGALQKVLSALKMNLNPAESMRQPGEDPEEAP